LWWFFDANLFTGWYVNLEIRGQRWSDGQRRDGTRNCSSSPP
jgi:hypothetical protein